MKLELEPIETKRLLLRPVELHDASDLFQIYGDARVVMGSISMLPFTNIDEMLHSIQTHFFAYRQRGVPQSMAIEKKDSAKVIGVIDFHTVKHDIGELGYMLNYDEWHQGYMSEAIQAMVQIGFTVVGFHRIEAMVEPSNAASWKALEHCGFQKEGLLRKYMKLNDQQYHDFMIYSILKEDYQEEVK